MVAGLFPLMHGLDSRSVRVGFLADRLALGQACLRVLPPLPVSIVPPMFATHIFLINYRHCVTLAIDSVLKWSNFPSASDQTLSNTYLETRLNTLIAVVLLVVSFTKLIVFLKIAKKMPNRR
jgi:subtilase family serine protease